MESKKQINLKLATTGVSGSSVDTKWVRDVEPIKRKILQMMEGRQFKNSTEVSVSHCKFQKKKQLYLVPQVWTMAARKQV